MQALAGLAADGRQIVTQARTEAANYLRSSWTCFISLILSQGSKVPFSSGVVVLGQSILLVEIRNC